MAVSTHLIWTEFFAAAVAALAAMSASHQAPAPTATTVQSVPAAQAHVVEAPSTEAMQTPIAPAAIFGDAALLAPAPTSVIVDPRAQQVLELVNAERNQAGCDALQLEPRLTRAALAHSQDMANRNYFDHHSPDGSSPSDRVRDAGYNWSGIGENIASGYETPQEVMDSWMNSKRHRANILTCHFEDIGIGVVDKGDEAPYWTQEFGTTSNDEPAVDASTWQRGQKYDDRFMNASRTIVAPH